MGQWMFTHLLPWICRSGFGEGPRPASCTSLYDLKVTNLLAPRNSLAIDDTLKREISVVTLSWLGERNIRDVTWRVGHCTVIRLLQLCVQTFGTGEAGFASLSDILYFPFSFLFSLFHLPFSSPLSFSLQPFEFRLWIIQNLIKSNAFATMTIVSGPSRAEWTVLLRFTRLLVYFNNATPAVNGLRNKEAC